MKKADIPIMGFQESDKKLLFLLDLIK